MMMPSTAVQATVNKIHPDRFLISDLCYMVAPYLSNTEVQAVYAAYIYAAEAHEGQQRGTGEAYIFHPLTVARILAEIKVNATTLQAALLHDVIEDTNIDKKEIRQRFGRKVAHLVDGVSKLHEMAFESKEERKAASFRKLILASTRDIRVILIKLADRLHNMRTLGGKSAASSRRIALETLNVYVPIAERLGVRNIAIELQELGFKALHPNRYKVINERLNSLAQDLPESNLLDYLIKKIEAGLKEAGLDVSVEGAKKNSFYIFNKMQQKRLKFNQIRTYYDINVVTKEENVCYQALGIIHKLYKPKPGTFKDYIAIPKGNNYQALHTSIIGAYSTPVDIQIRTQKMQEFAQYGVMLNPSYQNNSQVFPWQWLQEDNQSNLNAIEFLNDFTTELYHRNIYVLTPKGQSHELPRGATALDFAYKIHTDVGNHAVSAVIDERHCLLSTPLYTGQSVTIKTSSHAHPKLNWLNFVQTTRAMNSIRSFFNKQSCKQAKTLGKRLLRAALKPYNLKVGHLRDDETLQLLRAKTYNKLLADVGQGKRIAQLVAKSVNDKQHYLKPLPDMSPIKLAIQGTEGLSVHYATCCHPIPDDKIKIHIDNKQGVVVHTQNCQASHRNNENISHWIDATWSKDIDIEAIVEIQIETLNQRGVLAGVAAIIAEQNSNIEDIRLQGHQDDNTTMNFCITVNNKRHLKTIKQALEKLPYVISAQRIKN